MEGKKVRIPLKFGVGFLYKQLSSKPGFHGKGIVTVVLCLRTYMNFYSYLPSLLTDLGEIR
jgi:hypothetical protein